jgi:fatty acid desaturase
MARTAENPARSFPESPTESATAWIRQASDLVADLQRRSAVIYWTDFLLSCFAGWMLAYCWFTAALSRPLAWLALLAVALGLNWARNQGAHQYGNYGERMTLAEQFGDSINNTGQTWLTVFLFPVGLRYHALHHLSPGLPHHNMGKAHARLTEQLPASCPYHAVSQRSYFAAVAALWRGARNTRKDESAVDIWRSRIARS